MCAGAPDGNGKFVQYGQSEAVPAAFGPLGCLAAGLSEDELGLLGDVIDARPEQAGGRVPIVVLSQADFRQPLRRALEGDLAERDCILPAAPAQVASPLILFSGLEQRTLQAIVRVLVQARAAGSLPQSVAFAVAVPAALDKPIARIYHEVAADQRAN